MNEPEYIAHKRAEYPPSYWTSTILCAIVILGCLYVGVKSAEAYLSFAHLEKNGVQTTGTIIERQRTSGGGGSGRGSANYTYHILYNFENSLATQYCVIDFKKRVTPRDKICRRTVSKQIISEAEYKSLSAPSDVRVTYLSDDKGTRSQVMELGGGKAHYVFIIVAALFFMILSVKLRQMFVRAARKDAYLSHLHPEK